MRVCAGGALDYAADAARCYSTNGYSLNRREPLIA